MRFIDQREAGEQLASRLSTLRLARPIVLGIPLAGARIGWEIARKLNAPMDVLLVDPVEIPGRPHSTLGFAVDGDFYPDEVACRHHGVTPAYAEILASAVKRAEVQWEDVLRAQEPRLNLHGRSVILVSDRPMDSCRIRAVRAALRDRGASEIVHASPFECSSRLELAGQSIQAVSLFRAEERHSVMLVNSGYQQATDNEIAQRIAQSRRRPGARTSGEELEIDDDAIPAATVEVTAV
jgi:putative phosphoribosyl transferase